MHFRKNAATGVLFNVNVTNSVEMLITHEIDKNSGIFIVIRIGDFVSRYQSIKNCKSCDDTRILLLVINVHE